MGGRERLSDLQRPLKHEGNIVFSWEEIIAFLLFFLLLCGTLLWVERPLLLAPIPYADLYGQTSRWEGSHTSKEIISLLN